MESNKQGEDNSKISEFTKASKAISDHKEHIKNEVISCSVDLKMNHYDLKLKILHNLEAMIKSRLPILDGEKGTDYKKYKERLENLTKNAEKELESLDTYFKSICDGKLNIFDNNLKHIQKLQHLEKKNFDIEMLKERKLQEQSELLKEIRRVKFKNEGLLTLHSKNKEAKKQRDESQKLIEDFQAKYITKLGNFVEIYEDLKGSEFELDLHEDDDQHHPEKSHTFGTSMHDKGGSYETETDKELRSIMQETDFLLEHQTCDTSNFESADQAINYYIDVWETKF